MTPGISARHPGCRCRPAGLAPILPVSMAPRSPATTPGVEPHDHRGDNETMNRRILILFLSLLPLTGLAAEPVLAWRSPAELQQPESVVYDAGRGLLYVSSINGAGTAHDGNGYISRLDPEGRILELKWVTGLDAPKGLAISHGRLYAADIDKLVEIDIASGRILKRYPAPGAVFLNDVAAAPDGDIYVSDMMTNRIHRLRAGRFEVWLEDPALENPNGLYVQGERLIVGCWGPITKGFSTSAPGHLKSIGLADKTIRVLAGGKPIGNLDGVEGDGAGGYYLTDWVAGGLLHVSAGGKLEQLLDLDPGSADLGYARRLGLLLIPMMKDGRVLAYRVGG